MELTSIHLFKFIVHSGITPPSTRSVGRIHIPPPSIEERAKNNILLGLRFRLCLRFRFGLRFRLCLQQLAHSFYIDLGVGELIDLLDLQGPVLVSEVKGVDGLAASFHLERVVGLVGRLSVGVSE